MLIADSDARQVTRPTGAPDSQQRCCVTSEGPQFLNLPLSTPPTPFFPLQGSNPGTVPPPWKAAWMVGPTPAW